MQPTDHVLSSDITNALWFMKEVKNLPIPLQEFFYKMCDIYLSDSADHDEKESALCNIFEIWRV